MLPAGFNAPGLPVVSAYEWNNGDRTPEIKFLPFFSDYYKVTVTDSNGCMDSDSIYVTVNPLPVANAGFDTTICRGQSAFLSASGGISYCLEYGRDKSFNYSKNPFPLNITGCRSVIQIHAMPLLLFM